jgi:hypothetical protein
MVVSIPTPSHKLISTCIGNIAVPGHRTLNCAHVQKNFSTLIPANFGSKQQVDEVPRGL